MMRLPSTGWEKMSTFLEIYLICIINACSYGFLVACEHLWHAWNALVRLFQRIYQAPYPLLPRPTEQRKSLCQSSRKPWHRYHSGWGTVATRGRWLSPLHASVSSCSSKL